ncbi:MAG: hypothetical protein HY513_01785 [Candidatus Aenigmarchaeota archaeon]|nr:hypothetical protein [Candidatus Aenigmarchaeota archaeon]
MQVEISKKTEREIEKIAELTGSEVETVIDKALIHYIHEAKKMLELKIELTEWDKLSDEALENFERELWEKEKSG